ncbi:neutral amino acid transporter A [Echinococcus multilocularis]|uniref:Amino acid transporter n=1 Tax=Echinococcus multilocularis TaxID=6211 RepID=A0A0S4MIG1_ECHMU|nr:neutral amino acid transporter A [Echinococcus multilocularis]
MLQDLSALAPRQLPHDRSMTPLDAAKVVTVVALSVAYVTALPNIPSASVVAVITVLESIGVNAEAVSLLYAVEWTTETSSGNMCIRDRRLCEVTVSLTAHNSRNMSRLHCTEEFHHDSEDKVKFSEQSCLLKMRVSDTRWKREPHMQAVENAISNPLTSSSLIVDRGTRRGLRGRFCTNADATTVASATHGGNGSPKCCSADGHSTAHPPDSISICALDFAFCETQWEGSTLPHLLYQDGSMEGEDTKRIGCVGDASNSLNCFGSAILECGDLVQYLLVIQNYVCMYFRCAITCCKVKAKRVPKITRDRSHRVSATISTTPGSCPGGAHNTHRLTYANLSANRHISAAIRPLITLVGSLCTP